MEQIKRSQILDDNNINNKKLKLHDSSQIINKSYFENLPNETIYEIFDYLDINDAYEAFFNLNKRFQNLFLYSNLPIHVNISSMSKSNFERYHKNIILPNKHRINYIRLSNPFIVDIIFSPPRIISKFIQLEILILDNIKTKYLENIFIHLTFLSKLYSLTIHPIDYIENPTFFYLQIFRLPKLKYCQIEFESKGDRESLLFIENRTSSIEHLIIKNRFQLNSFKNLLLYLPRLRYLSINYLDGSSYYRDIELSSIVLKDFKSISLKLNLISFDQLEKLIKNSFYSIENLRLTTRYDPEYLNAKRWEELIISYIPNLHIFDINHDGLVRNNSSSYHDLINQFNSIFWLEKKWFFTHQHDWQERIDSAIFHSTDPYRRKDYTFYWGLNGQLCPHNQETNLNIVKHIRIGSKQATKNSENYFSNVNKLTLKNYFTTSDNSIGITLDRIIPLQQLTNLIIEYYEFPFQEIVQLIYCTTNLHTLKIYLLLINKTKMKTLEQSEIFRNVSTTNKIKNFELNCRCTFEQIQMLVKLFPRLEYFKIGIKRKEIRPIIRYILNHLHHLFFLLISQIPKVCLREVNIFIQIERLIENYFIKFINRDLYLWW